MTISTVYSCRVKRIDRYIFRQLAGATIFVAATLTGVVWLTQSLRFVEMIVNRGLSVPLFLYFTMLLLPSFLFIIIQIKTDSGNNANSHRGLIK